jgi:histidine ammonia-lyase
MEKGGINPVQLEFEEGIALKDGTQLMTVIAALAVCDAENLIETAEIATALSLEALRGVSDAFDERIHKVTPHKEVSIFRP